MEFMEYLRNITRSCRTLLLPVLLCSAQSLFPATAFSQVPRGVFSLLSAGKSSKDVTLSNPDVDGISIRGGWIDIEPTEGVFSWTYLDTEVARAVGAGKQVMLRISTQAGKPPWVTQAITDAGGLFFSFDDNGVPTTIPVFWDPTFLAKKKALIAAVGAHFTHNPAVKIMAASFANATSEDWNVPHTPDEVTKWLALGYTSEKMIDAGKQIIDATMVAFPNQYVTLAVAGDGNLDPDSDYVSRNAVANANTTWPGRLIVQKNCLSATNPPAPGTGTVFQLIWDSQPNGGAQMLWWCYGDATYRNNSGVVADPAVVLHNAVNIAVGYGINYIEIYQTDVVNLTAEISYAHAVLTGSALPPPGDAPAAPTGFRLAP
jgi:hypothetical protein